MNGCVYPLVLDVCCGPRSMWFDKKDSRAVFVDRRAEEHEKLRHCRKNVIKIEIKPDVLADFTELPFPDETFFHVVMDPPHYTERAAGKGHILKHYGCLFPGWQEMLSEGFRECFRVLKPGGTFIFKWCEYEIPLRDILALTPHQPLYGHRTGARQKTHWVAFIKHNAEASGGTPSAAPDGCATNGGVGMSDPVPKIQSAYLSLSDAMRNINMAKCQWEDSDWAGCIEEIQWAIDSLESAKAKIYSHNMSQNTPDPNKTERKPDADQ